MFLKNIKNKKSNWNYYAVKMLLKANITGKPLPELIDENYNENLIFVEESIQLIHAQSFNHAIKIAEKLVKSDDIYKYMNIYNQNVEWKLTEILDCFIIYDNLKSGAEIFSSIDSMHKDKSIKQYISEKYGDVVQDDFRERSIIFRN